MFPKKLVRQNASINLFDLVVTSPKALANTMFI